MRRAMTAGLVYGIVVVVSIAPALARTCRVLIPVMPGNTGTLNAIEVVALASRAFEQIDRDRNFVAGRDELRDRMTDKEIADDDPDKDGTIDKGEYLAAADARFKLADANQDNVVSCREMRSLAGKALLRLLAT